MLFEDMTLGPYEKGESKARRAFELYEDGKISQALSEIQAAIDITNSDISRVQNILFVSIMIFFSL